MNDISTPTRNLLLLKTVSKGTADLLHIPYNKSQAPKIFWFYKQKLRKCTTAITIQTIYNFLIFNVWLPSASALHYGYLYQMLMYNRDQYVFLICKYIWIRMH
jgi:hypothetical protein